MMYKLALVHPVLGERIRRLFAALKQEGYELIVTQGLRSWQEQNALYSKGRTAPGAIVTKAPGGFSQHNFGLAVDVAPDVANVIDWNVRHPAWQRMLALAPSVYLAEGAAWRTFPDNPHLYPAEIPSSCDILREKYQLGGIIGVWAWFDSLVKTGSAALSPPMKVFPRSRT